MNQEEEVLIVFTNEDVAFEEARVMYVSGKEDARKGDLGTITLPRPARDVYIDPQLPDPVVFSYASIKADPVTEEKIIRLRVVLVKIESEGGVIPSSCTVSVLVPAVGGNWVTRTADVKLVTVDGSGTATDVFFNPHGMVQAGEYLYFIDYETRLITYVKMEDLEAAGDNAPVPVETLDLSLTANGGLPPNARGQAIIALNQKIYALYLRTDPDATAHDPGVLLRFDLSAGATPVYEAKTTVGLNAQSIIPVKDDDKVVWLLIPAIGGPQDYEGNTNGTDSDIRVVQAEAATWLPEAKPVVTGDDNSGPVTAYDIHAVAAAMRDGKSQFFILTQIYTADAVSASWRLYQISVADFLDLANNGSDPYVPYTLTEATQLTTGKELNVLDKGDVTAPDTEFPGDIYFWDLLYEQTLRKDDEEDRLWLVLGSPFLVTKAEAYGSPTTPLSNPFVMFSGFGGINVNSVDLTIETLHQAQREVSLKRGLRAAKLGTGAGTAKAAKSAISTAGAAAEEEEKK
jgi:hypothetical protein